MEIRKKTKIRSGMNSIKKILLSQALLSVFVWIEKTIMVILQHYKLQFKQHDYEKGNDDTDGCRIRHHSKRSVKQ